MNQIATEIIQNIIRREGGFVNHPADKGGATKYGITAATLGNWRDLKRSATANEVKNLTQQEAEQIYYKNYIQKPGFENITFFPLLNLLVDYGVHSGTARATKALQTCLGVTADGIFGVKSNAALQNVLSDINKTKALYYQVLVNRTKFLMNFVAKNSSQLCFLNGFTNRLCEFICPI